MALGLEHERMRFSSMNERQLFARLNKITTEEKLRNFTTIAAAYSYWDLVKAAEKRMEELFGYRFVGNIPSTAPNIPPPPPPPQPIKPKEPVTNYRRALEF